MKIAPTWHELDEAESTQAVAAALLRDERSHGAGIVFAHHQTHGKGRFDRVWHSERGESLTMSLIFRDYADWPEPWLIGMAAAVAAARRLGSGVQWPNDLVFEDRKVGGILTELLPLPDRKLVPVVGLGINLLQSSFPVELSHATSVFLATGEILDPVRLATEVVAEIRTLPEPHDWSCIQGIWSPLDRTCGKRFSLPTGEPAIAVGIASTGALDCEVAGKRRTVLAADAWGLN